MVVPKRERPAFALQDALSPRYNRLAVGMHNERLRTVGGLEGNTMRVELPARHGLEIPKSHARDRGLKPRKWSCLRATIESDRGDADPPEVGDLANTA